MTAWPKTGRGLELQCCGLDGHVLGAKVFENLLKN